MQLLLGMEMITTKAHNTPYIIIRNDCQKFTCIPGMKEMGDVLFYLTCS